VKDVSNDIVIKSHSQDAIEKRDIENALGRNWAINKDDITVIVDGTKVKLMGTVGSWYQKEEAGRIAWNAPGVWSVENDLMVEYDYSLAD
jgi:osmotically-inducible protein OsmY